MFISIKINILLINLLIHFYLLVDKNVLFNLTKYYLLNTIVTVRMVVSRARSR